MKTRIFLILSILLFATANAATTNLNNNRINTYDLFAEGHATIGSTWNTTEWGLVVVNGTTLNSTLRVQGNAYFEGPVDFNGTVSGVQADSISTGTISRSRLPSELPYEDEANAFTLRQTYSNGFTAGANAYHTALTQMNSTTLLTWLYASGAVDVNGSFTASTNSYLEGDVLANGSVGIGRLPSALLDLGDATSTANRRLRIVSNGATGDPYVTWETNAVTAWSAGIKNSDSDNWHLTRASDLSAADIIVASASNLQIIVNAEIDGALDHDGTTAGFYAKAPIAQAADIVQVTDNTGGTISSTCAAIAGGAVPTQAEIVAIKNCLASLIAKINALDTVLDNVGLTA